MEGDEVNFSSEIKSLAVWITENNLTLITLKSKEPVADLRWDATAPDQQVIGGVCVEYVDKIKFLGTCITDDILL